MYRVIGNNLFPLLYAAAMNAAENVPKFRRVPLGLKLLKGSVSAE